MARKVTFSQLEQFLTRHDFAGRRPATTHRIYEHSASGTQIVLPSRPGRERVSPYHIAMVRAVLRNSGIAYEDFMAELGGPG